MNKHKRFIIYIFIVTLLSFFLFDFNKYLNVLDFTSKMPFKGLILTLSFLILTIILFEQFYLYCIKVFLTRLTILLSAVIYTFVIILASYILLLVLLVHRENYIISFHYSEEGIFNTLIMLNTSLVFSNAIHYVSFLKAESQNFRRFHRNYLNFTKRISNYRHNHTNSDIRTKAKIEIVTNMSSIVSTLQSEITINIEEVDKRSQMKLNEISKQLEIIKHFLSRFENETSNFFEMNAFITGNMMINEDIVRANSALSKLNKILKY
jgi:hypothetical protein